jgi:flavin-dependent dehydrogenase
MNNTIVPYHCAIIGGGLAGLCLSILLAKRGHRVVVFEKNKYPFHKVCGEYVSNESFGFLVRLGLKLDEWDLPQINNIGISSEKGFMFNARLGLGGFGISRYKLDNELLLLAKEHGVNVLDQTKVINVEGNTVFTNKGNFQAKICVGAFGKTNPVFAQEEMQAPATNYIGVKYHIRTNLPENRIELHNFRRGYCGVSKIEEDKYCLCYLSHSGNLKQNHNNIEAMEKNVLQKNPFLKKIFIQSEFVDKTPVTTSNIRFEARRSGDDKMLYIGDAAGCISPLTGNGMSMSGYTSSVLSALIDQFLKEQISREELHQLYRNSWDGTFLRRIRNGQRLQNLFGRRHLSDLALRVLNPFDKIKSRIIESTHGVPF